MKSKSTKAKTNKKSYIILLVGICLTIISRLFETHLNFVALIFALVGYSLILGLIGLVISLIRRSIRKYWLITFAWLFLIAGAFDIITFGYRVFVAEPQIIRTLVDYTKKQQWSHEERENIEHFLNSMQYVMQAHKITNSNSPSNIDFNYMEALYKKALNEAELVTDEVLRKANPELLSNYRLYFQKGVKLRISSWEKGTPYDEIQGSALIDSWANWYMQNRNDIKIPVQ